MNCTDVVKRCFVVLSVAALAVPAQPQSELPPDSVLAEEEILLVDPEAVPEEEIQTVDPQKVPKEPPEEEALPPIETMPELTEFVEAEYPEEVYAEGIEGAVLLDLLVSDSGTVDSAAVVESLHPVLDSTAREAARQFRFTPAIAGGDSVPVLLQYEYRFSLREIVRKLDKYENFTGRLLEMGTRAPISDALVVIEFLDTASDTSIAVPFGVYLERIGQFEGQYIEEDRLVTTTDSDGYFHFYSIPTGPVGITVPVPGYEQLKERETVTPGEAIVATYFLRRTSYSDYEIVVYGKTEKKEVSRRQLTLNEVKKIPGLGGDAVKVVQAMPGVSRPAFGSGEIVVRGAPSWDSQYYLDGLTIPLLYHFG
jgi:TonB family protein